MPRIELKVAGAQKTVAFARRYARGLARMEQTQVQVGSRLPYAYGIETGRHRVSGRVARAAGGVYYLQRAVNAVLADADKDVSEGLERVGAPGPWVLRRLGRWARRLARLDVVRKSGRLRRSLTVLVGKRGA